MSDTHNTGLDIGHPAPARGAIGLPALLLTLAAGPAAWLAQLLFAFASTSYLCRADDTGSAPFWLAPALIAINLIALLTAAVALVVAIGLVSRTAHEHDARSGGVLDAGEGRTRFLAHWGAFISAVFIVAILANTVSLLLVPLCRT